MSLQVEVLIQRCVVMVLLLLKITNFLNSLCTISLNVWIVIFIIESHPLKTSDSSLEAYERVECCSDSFQVSIQVNEERQKR